MSPEPLISLPLRPLETVSQPTFSAPGGTWDTHVHIFGSAERYPHVERPHYTLPDGTLAQYRALMPRLGVHRFVIVQPSFYGTDNSCLIDSLSDAGERARGVVMIDPDVSDAELNRFHQSGARAVRLDLFKRSNEPVASIRRYVTETAARVHPLGWHLQFYAPGYVVRDLVPYFRTLRTNFVIDHMGYMLEEDGLRAADFGALLDLLESGYCYLKLSGVYRIAKNKGYEVVEPVAKAIVERAPDRALWGSDWPHISYSDRDTGEILSLLERWAPSEGTRRAILVENPNRLFGVA